MKSGMVEIVLLSFKIYTVHLIIFLEHLQGKICLVLCKIQELNKLQWIGLESNAIYKSILFTKRVSEILRDFKNFL